MIEVRLAGPGDEAGLQPLLEQPVGGAWRIATRFPSGLAAGLATLGERTAVVVAVDGHGVLACGVRAVRPVWWAGRATRLGYLALLRCHARLPLHGRHGVLARCLACLAADRRSDELPWDLTAILASNQVARRLLERGLPGVPAYQRIATHVTQVLCVHALARHAPTGVRPAMVADLPALVRLVEGASGLRSLITPAVSDNWWVADHGAGPIGCVRLADLRNQRRLDLVTTPQLSRWSTTAIDWWRAWRRLTPLPQPGSLSVAYLDALRSPNPQVALALAAAAAAAALATGATRMLHGWTTGDPLIPHLPGGDRVITNWYAVGAAVNASSPFHQELATL